MGIVQQIKRGKPLCFYKELEAYQKTANPFTVKSYSFGMEGIWERLLLESTKEHIPFSGIQDYAFRDDRVLFLYGADSEPVGTAAALFEPGWGPDVGMIRYLSAASRHNSAEVYAVLIEAASEKIARDGRKAALIELWDFYDTRIEAALQLGFVPWPLEESQQDRFRAVLQAGGHNEEAYAPYLAQIHTPLPSAKDPDHLERSSGRRLTHQNRESRDVGISIDALADEWLYKSNALGETRVTKAAAVAGARSILQIEYTCGEESLLPGDSVFFGMRGQAPLGLRLQNKNVEEEGHFLLDHPENVQLSTDYDVAQMVVGFYVQAGRLSAGDKVVLRTEQAFTWTPIAGKYPVYTTIKKAGETQPRRLCSPSMIQLLPAKAARVELYGKRMPDKPGVAAAFIRVTDEFENPTAYDGAAKVYADEEAFEVQIIDGTACLEIEGGARSHLHLRVSCDDFPEDTAVVLLDSGEFQPCFGDMHCHDFNSEAHGDCEEVYRWAKTQQHMDFLSVSVQSHGYISNEKWVLNKYFAEQHLEEGRFVTFLANEWQHAGYGDKIIHYLNGDQPYFPVGHPHYDCAAKLYEAVRATDAVIISHHLAYPSGAWCPATNYAEMETDVDRLVELWSMHGSSEGFDNNDRPLFDHHPENTVMEALKRGIRVGFTAGSDTHSGRPGGSFKEPLPYYGGIVGLWARELTRKGIFEAIWSRRTYALTKARIVMKMLVNDAFMGSELPFAEEVRIDAEVLAPSAIRTVQLMKNAELYEEFQGEGATFRLAWRETISEPAFYHMRVVLEDGNLAVCSPVWVG